jgi:Mg2+ and Co2+ transporter CorA
VYEDKANETAMVLQANAEILNSICTFYSGIAVQCGFSAPSSDEVVKFTTQMDNMAYDVRMNMSRAKLLVSIATERKTLVRFEVDFALRRGTDQFQVLQHLQSQATEKMETLSSRMHELGVLSQKEAIVMRIITAVTLIFLPATFVSVRSPAAYTGRKADVNGVDVLQH